MKQSLTSARRPLEALIHIIGWGIMFGFPFFFVERENGNINWMAYLRHSAVPLSFMIAFYVNYFLLVPRYLFQSQTKRYITYNILLLCVIGLMLHAHSLAVAYGLHSHRERLDYYFVEQVINGKKESNRYLDFSKAHHFGFTYDWNINQNLHLKIEPYYQYLFHIPVEQNSSFSIINYEEFYLDRILTSTGTAKNYGIDITLEQYMKNGFYYMITGSLFKSKYRGGDRIWRNTRLDKSYLVNLLAGKEWMVGRLKQNVLSINGRLFFQGGGRYTPVDEEKSQEERDIVFDESKAYTKRFNPSINGDVSISFRINKKRVSHKFSLKILNVGMRTGMHFYEYNERTSVVEEKDGSGLIPNISYKIYF